MNNLEMEETLDFLEEEAELGMIEEDMGEDMVEDMDEDMTWLRTWVRT